MTTGIGLGVLAIALLMLAYKVWRSWQHQSTYFDAHYRTQAEDGWALGMYRYTPVDPQKNAKAVVILCHDLGSSPLLWEQDGFDSWPLRLKAMGYDVWSIGLRGTGSSRPHYLDVYHGWGWDMDPHLNLDVPAMFEAIQQQTPNIPIHWIGHGMGGALGLLAQSTHKLPLASVTVMGLGLQPLRRFGALPWLVRLWPRPHFPVRLFYQVASPILLLWKNLSRWLPIRSLRQEESLPLQTLTDLSSHMNPISTPLLQQWLRWVAQGQWLSSDAKHKFHKTLKDIACPTLCLSIPGDILAPPSSVQTLYQQLPEALRTLYHWKEGSETNPPAAHELQADEQTSHPSEPTSPTTLPGSHFAPIVIPALRQRLVQQIHAWHQTFAPFPPEKKPRRRRRKQTSSV